MSTQTLAAPLERARRLFPDRVAVVDGDTALTYRELDARVAGLDASLDTLSLGRGDVVAVLAANSTAHLIAWLAIPRSGRVLNDLNTRLSAAELEFILNDSVARALLVDETSLDSGRQLLERCPRLEHLIYTGGDATPDGAVHFDHLLQAPGRAAEAVAPETTAGIFYTGGTTGNPKGVILSHANLVANAKHALICLQYSSDDVYLHAGPMFHLADGASTYALTWAGGCHAIVPGFTPASWLHAVDRHRVSRAMLVPTMLTMLLAAPELATSDTATLKSILYGASPMPQALLTAAIDALGCDFCQVYGMTEAAPIVTFLDHADHRAGVAGGEHESRRLRSAGRPAIGVEVEIRDLITTAEVPAGEPGEIWLRGPNVMQGYLGRPDETAAALQDDGWYRSGDVAYLDEHGYLYVVDRAKDMIISGGENVYSTEVENALHRHPDVLECAVYGVPDDRWGERVHATVVLRDGAKPDADALTAHCRDLIASYKLPRGIDFVVALPKSGAGKVLKRELRDPHWTAKSDAIA
jgi:long-chain acyl-CoA synthetase